MGIKLFNPTTKLIQQRSSETLQLAKCVVKDVNFNGNKRVMGIKLFNSTMKLIQQRSSETKQLAKCVGKDVNFNRNKCTYGYKNSSI